MSLSSPPALERLPHSVHEIADVIGRELALYLIGQLPRAYSACHPSGQVIMYVPKTLKPDHALVAMLGWPAAKKLVRVFGGEILQPATCAHLYRGFRDRSIRRLLGEGYKPALIAEWFDVCERHVRNMAREIPQEAFGGERVKTAAVNYAT